MSRTFHHRNRGERKLARRLERRARALVKYAWLLSTVEAAS